MPLFVGVVRGLEKHCTPRKQSGPTCFVQSRDIDLEFTDNERHVTVICFKFFTHKENNTEPEAFGQPLFCERQAGEQTRKYPF